MDNYDLYGDTRKTKDLSPIYKPYVPKNNSIAQLNRHTNLPHEHEREISRRLKNKTS